MGGGAGWWTSPAAEDVLLTRFEQDIRTSPSKILDLCSGSGQLSKVLGRLESTEEIRMLDMSGQLLLLFSEVILMVLTSPALVNHTEKSLWRDPDDDFDGTFDNPSLHHI